MSGCVGYISLWRLSTITLFRSAASSGIGWVGRLCTIPSIQPDAHWLRRTPSRSQGSRSRVSQKIGNIFVVPKLLLDSILAQGVRRKSVMKSQIILNQLLYFKQLILIVEKVWFGLVWIDGLNKQKIIFFICFDWVWFVWLSLVWFGFFIPQTHKQINNYLILIGFICEFVFGYSTNKQTN